MTGSNRRMLRAGASTFVGVVFGAAATFALTGLLGNTLGATGTGLFFQAVALFAIVSNALQLGADTALVRTLSRQVALGERRSLPRTALLAVLPVLVVSVSVGAVLWLSADPLAAALSPTSPSAMADTIRALAPFATAGSMLAVLLGGTRGLGGTAAYTLLLNVTVPAARLVVVGFAVTSGLGLQSIVGLWAAPLVLAAAVAAVVLRVMLTRESARAEVADARPVPALREFTRLWGFALPRGAATVLERALDWGGVLIVIALAGPAAGGVYAVVTRVASAGSMIDQAARIVVGPRISRALAIEDRDAAQALFLGVTRALVLLSWPFYLTLAAFAPLVLSFFGEGFAAGAPALVLVAMALMLATTAGMVQSILLMGGKSTWQLMNRALQLTTLVTVTLLLVPTLGILGAAIGWVCAIALDTALATYQVARRMRIRTSLPLLAPALGLATAVFGVGGTALALLLGQNLSTLAVAAAVLGPLYLLGCWLLRERLGLTSLLRRSPHPEAVTPTPTPHDRESPRLVSTRQEETR